MSLSCLLYAAHFHPVCVQLLWPVLCVPSYVKLASAEGFDEANNKDCKERPITLTPGKCEDGGIGKVGSVQCPPQGSHTTTQYD